MTIFNEGSPWQEWVDLCRQIDSEREDFEPDESKCDLVMWARGLGDITLAEAIRGPCMSWQGSRAWAWAVTIAWHRVPASLRADVLLAICVEAPMAALTYERMADALSEAGKSILWAAFADKMPVMREKLARDIGVPKNG